MWTRRWSPGQRGVACIRDSDPQAGVKGSVALRDEVLDGPNVGAVAREVIGGVAFPAAKDPCRISRISIHQMNLLAGIEANAGLSGLEIGLSGESLTNVVVEKASQEEERTEKAPHPAAQLTTLIRYV